MNFPSSQQSQPTSQITFLPCERCKGFGYEITAAKKHLTCPNCKDDPSLYALYAEHLLFWGASITQKGMTTRRVFDFLQKFLTSVLFLFGVLGILSLIFAAYQSVVLTGVFVELFFYTEPNIFVGIFWVSVITDLFLYYLLEQKKKKEKEITYARSAKKEKNETFVYPTFEKYKKQSRHAIDIADYFSKETKDAIESSFFLAKKLGHHQITPLHYMAALLETDSVSMMMARLGVSRAHVIKKIGSAMGKEGIGSGIGINVGIESKQALFFAYEQAHLKRQPIVEATELFVVLIRHDPWLSEIFYDLQVDAPILDRILQLTHVQDTLRRTYAQWRKKSRTKPKGVMNRAMTARESPLLQSISKDYTRIAAIGGFFPQIGRDREMEQVLRILRERVTHVLLVGPSGVGKSTLFEGLAQLMASEDVPKELQDKRLVVLDPGALIADAQGIGVVEGRIQKIIHEIARAGNILLGIEDIHHLLNMRSTAGSEDVASILMNALSQGAIQVIATTTTEEYQQYIVQRSTFLRRFQVVKVEELSEDAAIEVLEARCLETEYKHSVFFTYEALASIVEFSTRYIPDRYLPSKALDIMREVGAYVEAERGKNQLVQKEDIAAVVSQKTNIQLTSITQNEREKLLNLESLLHERVVGQEEAIAAVASALRRAREGLRDMKKPIANVLFLGPTGVGKTETAKAIAEVYFGDEKNMIRLDMSEYQDTNALYKLIGRKGEQGILTEAIRLHPFSLILLDELEKAHPDILNVFLQVMDDGRLTDGLGKTFDLTNTMIIATSNAGAQQLQSALSAQFTQTQIQTLMMEEVLPQIFRPEFINRFDNVVIFTPLTRDEVSLIATRLLEALTEKIASERGVFFVVTKEALEEIVTKGYDPLYGARPLNRVIQDTVNDALSQVFLREDVGRRDRLVLYPGGKIVVEPASRI